MNTIEPQKLTIFVGQFPHRFGGEEITIWSAGVLELNLWRSDRDKTKAIARLREAVIAHLKEIKDKNLPETVIRTAGGNFWSLVLKRLKEGFGDFILKQENIAALFDASPIFEFRNVPGSVKNDIQRELGESRSLGGVTPKALTVGR